jgi:hypothetical protein
MKLNMRLALTAALVSAAALSAPAALAQEVYLEFAPEVGTVWKVRQTRSQIKAEGATPTESEVSATISVIGETSEGYVMEWTTDSVSTAGLVIRNQPNMLVGVPIRYDTNADGTPIRLHDLDGILDAVYALIGDQYSDETNKQARNMFTAMRPEEAAVLLVNDAAIIMQCHNYKLEPGVVIQGTYDSPNPVGGPAILTNSMTVMEDPGAAGQPARIRREQSFDPESAAASIYATIKAMIGKTKAESQLRDGKLPDLAHTTRVTCHIDVETGVAIRVDNDKETRVDGSYTRDTRTLTLSPG